MFLLFIEKLQILFQNFISDSELTTVDIWRSPGIFEKSYSEKLFTRGTKNIVIIILAVLSVCEIQDKIPKNNDVLPLSLYRLEIRHQPSGKNDVSYRPIKPSRY